MPLSKEPKTVQMPSVGRIVHVYAPYTRRPDDPRQPLAAIVTWAGQATTLIHATAFQPWGPPHMFNDVPWGDATKFAPDIPEGPFWDWPPRV